MTQGPVRLTVERTGQPYIDELIYEKPKARSRIAKEVEHLVVEGLVSASTPSVALGCTEQEIAEHIAYRNAMRRRLTAATPKPICVGFNRAPIKWVTRDRSGRIVPRKRK